ncbi:MAG: glycosyltransferase family 39 protein [bacterium]|nr:glycosyltransferase family 39 protein [bacterium]
MKSKLLLPLILLSHLILLLNLRFTAWPEMTLWPYLLDRGLTAYRDIVIVYPPVSIMLLAFLGKLFGQSLFSLQIYTWFLVLSTDILVYLIGKKVIGKNSTAQIALLFYIPWQLFFDGNGLWFDLLLAPLSLLVFYFLWEKKYFWTGIFFGLSLLIKQTAFWFLIPIFFTFWINKNFKLKPLLNFSLGIVVLVILSLLYLIKLGILPEFYQWAINFGLFYLPRQPGQVLLPTFKNIGAMSVPYGFLLIGIWFLLKRKLKEKNLLLVLMVWSIFGFMGAFSRWEYFHFQPSLPFLAILSGIVITNFKISMKKDLLPLLVLVFIVTGTIYLQVRFYSLNWQKPTRFFESDILETASWIKSNTTPGEKIYILNSWDHLYALSGTLPAVSPLIHTLPWHLEYPGMQEKYVSDLATNKPKMIVFQPYSQTGLGSYRPAKIDKFIQENYNLSDIVAGRFWILKLK